MIINGKKEAQLLRDEIKKEIESIKLKNNKVPGLTVILIGDFAPSQIYVKNKEKNAKEVGINSEVVRYSKDVSEQEVLKKIKELNKEIRKCAKQDRKQALLEKFNENPKDENKKDLWKAVKRIKKQICA